jgi:hypothetical protein
MKWPSSYTHAPTHDIWYVPNPRCGWPLHLVLGVTHVYLPPHEAVALMYSRRRTIRLFVHGMMQVSRLSAKKSHAQN